jgi:predicted GNAT family acetyltransferase
MADDITVLHDASGSRFLVKLEGYEACLMYRQTGNEIDLYHTYVPEVFRGKGMAEKLCKAAFEHAKAQQLRVVPSCSYISGAYLKRHPEYEPLTQRGGPSSNPIVSG